MIPIMCIEENFEQDSILVCNDNKDAVGRVGNVIYSVTHIGKPSTAELKVFFSFRNWYAI